MKQHKRLYYNKLTKTLFRETKAGSGLFTDGKNGTVTNIEVRLTNVYIDLSVMPAIIYKNFGKSSDPIVGEVMWWCDENRDKKMYLVYIEDRISYKAIFRKVNGDGTLAKKRQYRVSGFYRPMENYVVDKTVRLL